VANSTILKLERWALYFVSIVMALGTINPFNISSSTREGEVQSFLIYPAVLIIIVIFLFDKKARKIRINEILLSTALLLLLWLTIFCSDFIYIVTNSLVININYVMFIKLLMCIISYYILTFLFIRTNSINKNLLIYGLVSMAIVMPFFIPIGPFSNCFEFSNGRLWMYGENPNTFSARLCIAIIYFAYCITERRYNKCVRLFFLICICVLTYFVLLSGSRGSLAIVAISLLYLLIKELSLKWIIFFILPLCLLISVIFLNLDSQEFVIFERYQSLVSGGDLREILMKEALNIWEDNIIIGCGINGYDCEKLLRFNEHLDSHCIVTSILAMSGIIGLLCYAGFMCEIFSNSINIIKKTPLSLIFSLFMFAVSLKTGGIISYFFMYYIYSICMSQSLICSKK